MTRTRTVSGPNGVEVVEFTEAENAERDAEELAELGRLKPEAKAEIDRQAEAARQAFVTPGAAQQSVYLSKAAEAERLASDGSPDPADYPLLAASIGLEGATLAEVAAVVIAQRNAWVSYRGRRRNGTIQGGDVRGNR